MESMNEKKPQLPFDILTLIVEFFAFLPNGRGRKALSSLSRTCRALHPLCQSHIFSTISLRPRICDWSFSKSSKPGNDYDVPSMALKNMEHVLESNPGIANYVRTLYYHSHESNSEDTGAFRLLNKFNRVEKLVIMPYVDIMDLEEPNLRADAGGDLYPIDELSPPFNWKKLHRPLQQALEKIIHLPTLSTLELNAVLNFPADILLSCPNLHALNLSHSRILPVSTNIHLPNDFIPVKLRSITLCPGATSNASVLCGQASDGALGTYFDLSQTCALNMTLNVRQDEQLVLLLKALATVEVLDLTFGVSNFKIVSEILTSRRSLLANLRRLSLSERLDPPASEVWGKELLMDLLNQFRPMNLLEKLDIHFTVYSLYEYKEPTFDVLGRLAVPLSGSSFISLKSLSIDIRVVGFITSTREEWDALATTYMIDLVNNPALDFKLLIHS